MRFVIVLLLVLAAPAAHADSPPPSPPEAPAGTDLTIEPRALFQKETTTVHFKFAPATAPAAGTAIDLIQLPRDPQPGLKVETAPIYLGILSDTGVGGDRRAGDGAYGRRLQISYKGEGFVTYAAREVATGRILATGRLNVIRRPSFMEMLGEVFRGLRNRRPPS